MADLDDFFAKKDRKKSKGKKFMTTEEIAKKLEETGKKVDKPKKDKATIPSNLTSPDGEDLSGNIPEDEEWKDFEEEKKDYTGLKIQNLTIQDLNDGDGNDPDNEGGMEENEQGEMVPKKKGPWKVIENVDSASVPAAQPVAVAAAATAAAAAAPVTPAASTPEPPQKSSYVPPHLRNQYQPSRDRNVKTSKPGAPDITNQDFFPTLGAATNETSGSWNRRKQDGAFEEVRNSRSHSNRSTPTGTSQSLQIGNKFGALESEHS